MTTAAGDKLVASLLLGPTLAAIAFSFARLVGEQGDVPRDEDYPPLAAMLDAAAFDGAHDGLAVLPPWSLRPHVVLKRFAPMGSDGLAASPLHRYRRLFVVVEPDAEPYTEPLVARLGAPAGRETSGRVELWRFELEGPRARYDFLARLADAQVAVEKDGAVATACDAFDGARWRCSGRDSYQRVSAEWQLVTENPRRVLWAHPPPSGEALSMTWPAATLGDAIVVMAGHTRDGADAAAAPVVLEVLLDGERVDSRTFPPAFDWRHFEVPTPGRAGTTGAVTLRVSTTNHGKQHFCVDGYTIGAAP